MARQRNLQVAAACFLGAGMVVMTAPAAGAAAQTLTEHQSIPVDGAVVTCGTTNLTASGSFAQILHLTQDTQGILHVTGTGTPEHVTLDDGAGNTYSLRGATWFGGNFTDPDGNDPIVLTSTDKFAIINAGGGLFGMVNVTEHLSPNGNMLSLDLGSCESP